MEWLEGDRELALNAVLRSVGIEGRGGVVVLRGKRSLEDAAKEETRYKEREAWIKLRALLDLLAASEPSGALGVFDEYLSRDREDAVNRESLTVACLLMLYHYSVVLKNPMQPIILRERVAKALDEYPSNSVIVGLFLEGEKGQGVWGRVRAMLGDSRGSAKSVSRRILEVWIAGWERGRWESELERTRSGLAAAVDNERYVGIFSNIHHLSNCFYVEQEQAMWCGESIWSLRYEQGNFRGPKSSSFERLENAR